MIWAKELERAAVEFCAVTTAAPRSGRTRYRVYLLAPAATGLTAGGTQEWNVPWNGVRNGTGWGVI